MANKKVTLVWYAKTPTEWRRFNVLTGNNGRIRTGVVIDGGSEKTYPHGRFELRSYEGKRTVYKPAGTVAAEAQLLLRQSSMKQTAKAEAKRAGLTITTEEKRKLIRKEAEQFISEKRSEGKREAAEVYRRALDDLMKLAIVQYVDEIDRETFARMEAELRKQGKSDRTIANKHGNIRSFLIWAGIEYRALKARRPAYEKKLPVVYGQGDIEKLRQVVSKDAYWTVALSLLRMTGLREQEAVYLTWADLDLTRKVLRVRSKAEFDFKVKDKEERDVPLPDALVTLLQGWRQTRPKATLVLGTEHDRPNAKLLRGLKRLAKNAGLNCNACDGCKRHKECRKFTLHAFRRSYATSLLRAGIDARTIMALMGHSDIETTMRYLAAMDVETAQPLVNKVEW